jgi:two-component system, sensor histidine kinase and response regulator
MGESALSLPSQLAILDRAIALSRVGGDLGLLQEMAQLFLQECPSQMDTIRSAVKNRDARAIERGAHSLKGSVGNFGALAAEQAAAYLETLGRSGRLDSIDNALLSLESAIGALQPAMRHLAVG